MCRFLVEAHLDIRALFQVDGFDETHLAFIQGKDHGRSAHAFTEEAHAFEQVSVGDTSAGEDHLFARSQIFGGVDTIRILDAHAREAFMMLGFADDEAGENLAIEAAQRRRR